MRHLVLLLLLLSLPACGVRLGWPDYPADSSSDQDSADTRQLRIFVTSATTTGAILTGGVTQADAFCQQDANRPTGTYKAMLSDGSDRIGAPFTQTGWVLEDSRTYIRTDGTVIGTTTSEGIFNFPLTNAIDPASVEAWTGIDGSAWAAGSHCNGWTDGTVGQNGTYGQADATTVSAITILASACNVARHLYCVEQP